MEVEVVSLKGDLDKSNKNSKSSHTLDFILNFQRPLHDKFGLGYTGEYSNSKEETNDHHKEKPRSFVDVLKGSYNSNPAGNKVHPRNEKQSLVERNVSSWKYYLNKYPTLFLGHCFFCKKIGHQAKHCKMLRSNYQNKTIDVKKQDL